MYFLYLVYDSSVYLPTMYLYMYVFPSLYLSLYLLSTIDNYPLYHHILYHPFSKKMISLSQNKEISLSRV
jgi:hypothetical protein